MVELPRGTVTFLFTDLEGSTLLLASLGAEYAGLLEDCRTLLRDAIRYHGGQEVDTQGDALSAVFSRATDAVTAAVAVQQAVAARTWLGGADVRMRIGLHSGEPMLAAGGYVGMDVHRAARICQAAHGGQIVISQTTRDLVADSLPNGVAIHDLGEYQLKDLARPLRLHQITVPGLPTVFAALRASSVRTDNLPVQLMAFIGRERELAAVTHLLASHRLVTLTGAGGAGKSRLAIEAAAQLVPAFRDGVWLIELAPLSDAAMLPQAVAVTVAVQEQPGRALTETLADVLQSRSLLLVLDNCEHLVSPCAALVERLLKACPRLQVLATSRETLNIEAEITYHVPSLSAPNPAHLHALEQLLEYDAVLLFLDRATRTAPTFALTEQNARAVAEVCAHLDGMPLAIELAAARLKVLSVEQIASRLHDRFRLLTEGTRTSPPRHGTLLAAMDWSYQLLSQREQRLLRRLAAFAGGFTLEAAEQICTGDGLAPGDVLDLLSALVEKSLVLTLQRNGTPRYGMLETVREYSLTKLRESSEESAVRRRHRDWWIAFLEHAEAELYGPQQKVWFNRLDEEHDNFRAALRWCLEQREVEAGIRLVGAMGWFWYLRGFPSEGRSLLKNVLSMPAVVPKAVRAKALNRAGLLAQHQGDYAEAVALCEEGRDLATAAADIREGSVALHVLGNIAWQPHADYRRARELFEQQLQLARDSSDRWMEAMALHNLGRVSWRQGDYAEAQRLLETTQSIFAAIGDAPNGTAWALHSLGLVARSRGDYARATEYHARCLELFRELGQRAHYALAVNNLGVLARHQGNYARATALGEESLELFKEIGDKAGVALAQYGLGQAALLQGQVDRAERYCRDSLTVRHELADRRAIAESIEGVAAVAAARHHGERAAILYAAAEALREQLGAPVPGADRAEYDRTIAALRGWHGEEGFVAAWSRGRVMSEGDAVAYALAGTGPVVDSGGCGVIGMADSLLEEIRKRYRRAHERLFKMVDGLTVAQLAWRPTPQAHNIAFQTWHLARLDDYFQSRIPSLAPQLERKLGPGKDLWKVEGLASKWGFDPAKLGWNEVGFGMDDAVAAGLRFPPKEALLEYVRRALSAADRAVETLNEQDLMLRMTDWAGEQSLAGYIVEYIAHDEWDIGQIAGLRRAQGLPRVMA
jgi:predicted ATPase/class 3 adenylate cyclase